MHMSLGRTRSDLSRSQAFLEGGDQSTAPRKLQDKDDSMSLLGDEASLQLNADLRSTMTDMSVKTSGTTGPKRRMKIRKIKLKKKSARSK